ncbi:beta-1,3-galactosyltransferase pvg3-like [Phragmites australis]|uniref:beta-1,3-galactosyltransferase pvg3-like n=1 Tax=Phragmites australis TaxID=29695 RepID=UPI002D796B83|nr:beta-1,3-galactosyltransferase pvg3-like [Phragmites australis]
MPSPPARNLLKSIGNGKLGGHQLNPQAAMKRHGSFPNMSASSKALVLLPLLLLAFIFFFVYPKEFELQAVMSACAPQPGTYTAARLAEPAVTRKPDFRLLIGVLTRADLYERRHLLRMVYGLQLASGDLTAHIDVRYVFCRLYKDDQRVLVPLEILVHDDVIILDGCEENLNGGKTYTYLSTVAKLYADEPYDYVMKADDDIFFRLPQLVESLDAMPREDMYYGATIPCNSMDPFRGYMAGMGYVLSWDLVEWIATSDVARNHSVGTEDMLTGEWLRIGGKGKNRFNAKPAIHDYLNPVPVDECEHAFMPSTIAVHRLKSNPRWAETLKYFNFTAGLKPSKFYKID